MLVLIWLNLLLIVQRVQLDEFSTRSSVINDSLIKKLEDLKNKFPTANIAKLKEIIKLKSRPKKNKVNRQKVRENNNIRMEGLGITLDYINNLKTSSKDNKLSNQEIINIINNTVSVLTREKSVFSKEKLSQALMKITLKDGLIEEDFLHLFTRSLDLIKLDTNIYSSHTIIDNEKFVIKNIFKSTNRHDLLKKKLEISNILEFFISLEKKGNIKELSKVDTFREILEQYDNDTLVLTCTQEDRKKLNRSIRLYKELIGERYDLLENIELSIKHKYSSQAYSIGNFILLSNITGFRKGEKVEVTRIIDNKTIEVKTRDKKFKILDVSEYADCMNVFILEKKRLSIKEKIVFTKDIQDKKSRLRVNKGVRAIIKKIEGENITITLENKREKTFNINDVPYIDYGYAFIDFKSEFIPVSKVVVVSEINFSNNIFYEQLKKIRDKVTIYTTNKKKLKIEIEIKKLNQNLAMKKIQRSEKEHGNNEQVRSDREKSVGFDTETNRDRKEYKWDLYDISQFVKRATRRIRYIELSQRNYKYAKEFAKRIDGYQKAAADETSTNKLLKKEVSNNVLKNVDDHNIKMLNEVQIYL